MSKVVTSFKIWALTAFVNGFFFMVVAMLLGKDWMVMGTGFILLMGYVVGLPFWLLLWVLMEIASRLPYSTTGRICWVAGIMTAIIGLFYACVYWIVDERATLKSQLTVLLTGTTIAAFITSLYLIRGALSKTVSNTSISDNE